MNHLKNGGSLPASNIKVWYNTADNAKGFWTVDHRRLAAYKLAGRKDLNVEYIEGLRRDGFKMTTETGGTDMNIIIWLDRTTGKFVKPGRGINARKEVWALIEKTDGSMIIKNGQGQIVNINDIPNYLP